MSKGHAVPQKPAKYFVPRREYMRTLSEGRQVLDLTHPKGRAEYDLRKREMWERQGHVCCLCGRPLHLAYAEFEHERSKGMGGAFRDDRIEVDGKWQNGASCRSCNSAKGSVRGTYNDARNAALSEVL